MTVNPEKSVGIYNKLQIISVTGKENKNIISRLKYSLLWELKKKLQWLYATKIKTMINGYMWLTLLKSSYKELNTPFFVISTGIPFRRLCMLHLSPVCIFNTQDYVGFLSILYAALLLLRGLP